jgi:hypothetical protein
LKEGPYKIVYRPDPQIVIALRADRGVFPVVLIENPSSRTGKDGISIFCAKAAPRSSLEFESFEDALYG